MSRHENSKAVTLRDVAQRAGVSSSTVSRVLNRPDLVDESTKATVNKAIEELGYIHSKPKKRTTSKASSGTVAIMVPDLENPHFQVFVDITEKKLLNMNYMTMLCIFENNPDKIDLYFQELLEKKIDGCIMACLQPGSDSPWTRKFLDQIPTVAIQCDIEGIDSIMTTDEEGTYEMLENLVRLGHKKIGFIGYSWNLSLFERRLNAYKNIHNKYNLPLNEEYIGFSGADLQSGYEQGCRILSLPDRPTAIHCFNTFVAMGVYIAIRDKKLRIPEDISLSGFDDAPVANIITPPLSVVSQPIEAMAASSVNILTERMKGGNTLPLQNVVFPTSLIIRQSTGICPDLIFAPAGTQ